MYGIFRIAGVVDYIEVCGREEEMNLEEKWIGAAGLTRQS